MLRFLAMAMVLMTGAVLAEEVGEVPDFDFASWFSSPHALAAVVVGLVSLLRKHFVKLDGILVPALALVLGLVLAFLGNLLGYLQGNWAFFGLQAGLEAVMAVAGVRALLQPLAQKGGSEEPKDQDSSSEVTASTPTPRPKLK